MAKRAKKKQATTTLAQRNWRRIRRFFLVLVLFFVGLPGVLALIYTVVNPPVTHTIFAAARQQGDVSWEWTPIEDISPHLLRAVVAAEDAGFCQHWGFDLAAIRSAIAEGGERGGSTISQQTVKNLFLWQGRSWVRKGLEALYTPLGEAVWSKRRILELYVNVAEFGQGVFGAGAAARHYYQKPAADLTATQAARLAVLLPNPKQRDPNNLPTWLKKHSARVADGAATIRSDGRAACFGG